MAGLEGAFLCLGNPLLDVSAVVDQAFLDKYEVSALLQRQKCNATLGSRWWPRNVRSR